MFIFSTLSEKIRKKLKMPLRNFHFSFSNDKYQIKRHFSKQIKMADGITSNEITPNGISSNEVTLKGITPFGLTSTGITSTFKANQLS